MVRADRKYVVLSRGLVATLGGMLIWEVVRSNMIYGSAGPLSYPWRVSLLGVDTTATLLGGLVALVLARNQFALSVRPNIGCVIRHRSGEFLPTGILTTWLFNAGPGIVSIHAVRYQATIRGDSTVTPNEWMTREQVVVLLER